ncbi:hypothetical protein DPX16_2742 [Anabarilius grahami]|uniref:Uncharacterized protein n=1 Tax=Anabarilius grahami TaxID=495550 RepID=A0A3N0XGS9_ANAGA|nr:hypothetical protein DPX16_2742 [Anabarilius grahami]
MLPGVWRSRPSQTLTNRTRTSDMGERHCRRLGLQTERRPQQEDEGCGIIQSDITPLGRNLPALAIPPN